MSRFLKKSRSGATLGSALSATKFCPNLSRPKQASKCRPSLSMIENDPPPKSKEPRILGNCTDEGRLWMNTVRHESRRISVAVAVLLGVTLHGPESLAAEASFKDFPYLIYCQYRGIDHAYYFSRLGTDGRAIYMTPDRQAGSISIDGIAKTAGGNRSGNCLDKTLDQLRSAGQAFDLPR
jgi:hypothetical protein